MFISVAAASFAAPALSAPNTLTDAERKAGWKLLFDGKTTTGLDHTDRLEFRNIKIRELR